MNPNVTSVVEDVELVEKRRAQIVVAATELFSERGFYRTTIKDIAKKAGFSPGLVYLYVREKEDVLLLVLLQVVEAHAAELPRAIADVEEPLSRLIRLIEAFARVVDRHRAATALAYRSTNSLGPERRVLVQEREREVADIITAEVVACMKAGLVRRVDVDVVTHQIIMIAHGWALKSWYFKGRMTLEAYVAASLDIFLTGIETPLGAARRSDLGLSAGERTP